MATKIKSPNEKSRGFLWAIILVIIFAVALVGYIVISNRSSSDVETQNVSFGINVEDNAVVLKSDSATADTPTVDLYEDFSCPHCSELAIATDDSMRDAIDQGKLVVNVRTLNFLDRGENEDKGHSTKAGAAALAVAKTGDANLYWNYRSKLMVDQKKIYNRWDAKDFAKQAKDLGASNEVVKQIEDQSEKDAFLEEKTANTTKLETETGSVSSPRIVHNGKDVQPSSDWVVQVTGS